MSKRFNATPEDRLTFGLWRGTAFELLGARG
ncbi:hypothetical protein SUDANB105_07419 [Streptomyces sp. enrichment culture]